MKKILFLFITTSIISTGIFATPHRTIDSAGKIQKVFHQDFPEVTHFKIYTSGDEYVVYFSDDANHSTGRVFYDADGNILQTYKYYAEEELPAFIRAKIRAKYEDKDISNVTEVTAPDEHYYSIILKDSKQMLVVNSDDKGNLQLIKKYKRG